MGALCLSTAVLRHAPTHVRAPAPRKKPLSAPRGSALRQKTRHCPKPLTFSEMDIIIIKHTKSACLAQPVEHAAVNRSVGGSSPSTGAIERNRIAVSFLFLSFSSNPPDAVFALHDSRVQISWRKLAIPSRLALLTGVESAGRRHRRRKANFATPRATARGVCMYACAKPHRKFFRRGPRFYTPQNIRFAGTPV